MIKKSLTIILIIFLITISFSSAVGIKLTTISTFSGKTKLTPQNPGMQQTKPLTVYVDDDYTSSTQGWQIKRFDKIQDGINAVAKNGKVKVSNGIYFRDFSFEGKT